MVYKSYIANIRLSDWYHQIFIGKYLPGCQICDNRSTARASVSSSLQKQKRMTL